MNLCTPAPRAAARPLALMALAALALTGCMRVELLEPPTAERKPLGEPRPVEHEPAVLASEIPDRYEIGPRDVLRIDVEKDPELSQEYPVNEQGQVLVPNIGPVKVDGLTTLEAESLLAQRLSQIIREPQVKVGVQEYRSKVVYVIGEVNQPGVQFMRANMLPLDEAIMGAGMTRRDAALKRVVVITPHETDPIVRQINLTDIIYRGKMDENIALAPNDRVVVPSRHSTNMASIINELTRPVSDVLNLMLTTNRLNNTTQ